MQLLGVVCFKSGGQFSNTSPYLNDRIGHLPIIHKMPYMTTGKHQGEAYRQNVVNTTVAVWLLVTGSL